MVPLRGASDLIRYDSLSADCEVHGLVCRGGFHPLPDEVIPAAPGGARPATVVMLGFVGPRHFEVFASSPEFADGRAHPLDRWSRRVIAALAARHDATALFPFGGPPWLPFQRWAQRAESVHVSPINILIHPVYGLWHAYRGALAFAQRLELPPTIAQPSPCTTCLEKPCLHSCPVQALSPGRLDTRRCGQYLESTPEADCYELGCRARARCPVGAQFRYGPRQARFHLDAFMRSANTAPRA